MSNLSARIRVAPFWLFVLVLSADVFMSVLGNQWYIHSGIWKPLYDQTYGLLHPALVGGVVFFLVVICGVLLGAGRRRPAEVGLEWSKLPAAILYTFVIWVGLQIVLVAWYLSWGQSVAIANGWDGVDTLGKAGALLGQLLGNALCEEIVFRGFLLVQFVLLAQLWWSHQPRTSFVVALFFATLIFAVLHVPFLLRPDNYLSLSKLARDLLEIFTIGSIFGWLYWRTCNLFFVVGVHALGNAPTTLWAARDPLWRVDPWVYLLAIIIALAWQRLPATNDAGFVKVQRR